MIDYHFILDARARLWRRRGRDLYECLTERGMAPRSFQQVFATADGAAPLRPLVRLEPTRGRDVSDALTLARTVLSHAETATEKIAEDSYRGNVDWRGYWDAWYASRGEEVPERLRSKGPSGEEPDPDAEAIYADLADVVAILSRWRKTGRSKKAR